MKNGKMLFLDTDNINTEAKLSFAPLTIQNKKAAKSEKNISKKTRSIKMNTASFDTKACRDKRM